MKRRLPCSLCMLVRAARQPSIAMSPMCANILATSSACLFARSRREPFNVALQAFSWAECAERRTHDFDHSHNVRNEKAT